MGKYDSAYSLPERMVFENRGLTVRDKIQLFLSVIYDHLLEKRKDVFTDKFQNVTGQIVLIATDDLTSVINCSTGTKFSKMTSHT